LEVVIVIDDNKKTGGAGYLLLALTFGVVALGIAEGPFWGFVAACAACVALAILTWI
jgi:hypothetical protein